MQAPSETKFEISGKGGGNEKAIKLQEQASFPQMQPNNFADDQLSSSSEESDTILDPEFVTEKLREILRAEDAMDFNLYIAQ